MEEPDPGGFSQNRESQRGRHRRQGKSRNNRANASNGTGNTPRNSERPNIEEGEPHVKPNSEKRRTNRHRVQQAATHEDPTNSASSSVIFITAPPEDAVSVPKHMLSGGRPSRTNRKGHFGFGLTVEDQQSPSDGRGSPRKGKHTVEPLPEASDLVNTLITGLSKAPYIDCPICFNPIHPAQPTWNCSPLIPTVSEADREAQCCWTTFHMKCIRPWAEKNFNEVKAAWAARGQPNHGEWRCPGCQARRQKLISGYRCFCGSISSPQPGRLVTPHSCGSPCSRPRVKCSHPCPLLCHPGPCPPCRTTVEISCSCYRKERLLVRCGQDNEGVSCGKICSRALSCGNPEHVCTRPCHTDECAPCREKEVVNCWCGRITREDQCGAFNVIVSTGDLVCGDAEMTDSPKTISKRGLSCGQVCERPFACGTHTCQKLCHPFIKSLVTPCPLAPENIRSCPCGKKSIASNTLTTTVTEVFPARSSCTSPIPLCGAPCYKPLPQCDHVCQASCHVGPCPPCTAEIVCPCRCGSTTKRLLCSRMQRPSISDMPSSGEVLCDRPCPALRACGRHQCNRICCPLFYLTSGSAKGRGKKKAIASVGFDHDPAGLHQCDLICGKPLSCGSHHCEERDHRGQCPPCLRSSFEEMVCACGRTTLEPPIPCGTQLRCTYPCPRPPPECGHPPVPHPCHRDDQPCPPCPHLTSKECACGKTVVKNVRCSLEKDKIGCGLVCGKSLSCGFHKCERHCHASPCGTCSAVCGKPRKLCLPLQHPCLLPCHAPSSCPEDIPCQSSIIVTCPCERIKQTVSCNRSATSPKGRSETSLAHVTPKCNTECELAKRNARLAEALGIDTAGRNQTGTGANPLYSEELVSFARLNPKFVQLVEKAFRDFIGSGRKVHVLPHSPADKRKFIHELAAVYRMDAQSVDQEPHRSVQLIRRLDTRPPNLLLSACAPPGKPGESRNASNSTLWRNTSTPIQQDAVNSVTRSWHSHDRAATQGPALHSPSQPQLLCTLEQPHPLHGSVQRESPPATMMPSPAGAVPESWEDDAT